jgi:hypothetical protein
MTALNFKKQFASRVELGLKQPDHPKAKRQSIRAMRKDGRDPQVGDTLYLYTGMRTKACRKLGEAKCAVSEPIVIKKNHQILIVHTDVIEMLSAEKITELVKADGFETEDAFFDFFKKTHGFPFYGMIYKW